MKRIYFVFAGLFSLLVVLPLVVNGSCGWWLYLNNPPSSNGSSSSTPEEDDDGPCDLGTNNQSVNLVIPCGTLEHGSIIGSARLLIEEHQASAMVATPQALHIRIGSYTLKSVSVDSSGDRLLTVLAGNNNLMYFEILDGDSAGEPVLSSVGASERVKMVDANGDPVTENPVYYELYAWNGDCYRYSADTATAGNCLELVSMELANRAQTPTEMGLDIIRDTDGFLRQVKTPTRLLDIVVDTASKYHIDIYTDKVVGTQNTDGHYTVLGGAVAMESWVIQNSDTNNVNELTITQRIGSYNAANDTYATERTILYTYVPSSDQWTMTKDGGSTFNTYSHVFNTAQDQRISTRTIGKDGVVQFKTEEIQSILDWGAPLTTLKEYVDANTVITTDYVYYTSPSAVGSYTRMKNMSRTDGYWERYSYTTDGLLEKKVFPWMDGDITSTEAQSRVEEYNYTLLDSNETEEYNDGRARTVTEKTLGVVTKKTYFAYPVDPTTGERMEIEQQCLTQTAVYDATAPYDDEDKLYTIRTYYAASAGVYGGLLKSVQYPDGRLDTYTYEKGTYPDETACATIDPEDRAFTPDVAGDCWRETVVHGTVNSPAGIANKSTCEVSVCDKYDNEVLLEEKVYDGSAYERINWTVAEHDDLGHAVEVYYSDGTQSSGVWGTGCCGKDSGTNRDGVWTGYSYDDYKRVESVFDYQTVTSYTYDGKGRRLTTTRTGGRGAGPSLTASKTYDWRGRVLTSTDESGVQTQYAYDDVNRKVTTTYPGGGTRIETKYADGRIKSITGTAQMAKFYTGGVNSDGTLWARDDTAYAADDIAVTDADRRWTKTVMDMAGREKRTEKPASEFLGFVGVMVQENTYNGRGLLVLREARHLLDGIDSSEFGPVKYRYEYDELGAPMRSGIDYDWSGALEPASLDRVTDAVSDYFKEDGIWYQRQVQRVYPDNNSAEALVTSIEKTRLTGFGSAVPGLGVLTAERISTDVHGNDTVYKTYVDRNSYTVRRIVDVPTSDIDRCTVSVRGKVMEEISSTGVVASKTYGILWRPETTTITSDADGDGTDERTVSSTIEYYAATDVMKGKLIGKVKSVTDEAGNTTTYTYDTDTGLKKTEKKSATLADGSTQDIVTSYTYYNENGRFKRVEGGQYPVEYHYDEYGQMDTLKTWRDESGTPDTTTWEYEPSTGLLTQKRYADGKGPSYTYTPDGKLYTRTWAVTDQIDTVEHFQIKTV